MNETMPTKPIQCPSGIELENGGHWLRNEIVCLTRYLRASITWEMDVSASSANDEDVGSWTVEIRTKNRTFTGKYEELAEALWFASTHAKAAQEGRWAVQEQAKAAALEKLSPEERKLLGL